MTIEKIPTFSLAQRYDGDQAWVFYIGIHDDSLGRMLIVDCFDGLNKRWMVTGPLIGWMTERDIDRYDMSIVGQSFFVKIHDDALAFEFKMTYC